MLDQPFCRLWWSLTHCNDDIILFTDKKNIYFWIITNRPWVLPYLRTSMWLSQVVNQHRCQCDQKKLPNVYKSCPNMILAPLQKLPKNVGDLGKFIVAKGFKKLPKVQKIANSGHTDRWWTSKAFNLCSNRTSHFDQDTNCLELKCLKTWHNVQAKIEAYFMQSEVIAPVPS